jgi:2-amino-4-hydroxy-6-hydroxymethyldihydropteridine diphosphokinase
MQVLTGWLSGSMPVGMIYGIALGSNLTDRAAALQRGVQRLLELDGSAKLLAHSSLYETEPVDCPPGSPPFLNAVMEISSDLAPEALHQLTLLVEREAGRPELRAHHAPRPLDLDLLYADDVQMQTEHLILPHPRLHLRRFVLEPLAEIRPELVLPGHVLSVSQYLAGLPAE